MHKLDLTSDNGKFRAALLLSGFFNEAECIVFNDKNQNDRRLKLWRGQAVANASKKQTALLMSWLRTFFGERFMGHGFRDTARWSHPQQSFHIYISH